MTSHSTASFSLQGEFDLLKDSESVKIIVASQIFDKLAPLFYSVYVTEAVLLKLLLKFCHTSRHTAKQAFVDKILTLMWTCLEEDEITAALKNLFLIILTSYRFSQVTVDLKNQLTYLVLLLSLLRHERTRHLALECILFDIIQFPSFMHIKPPDDPVLEQLIPDVWWDKSVASKDQNNIFANYADEDSLSESEKQEKETYLRHCASLKMKITEIEEIQIEILKLLMEDSDANDSGKCSRTLFVIKLREFLFACQKGQKFTPSPCPLPVTLCFMHRLVKALRCFWDRSSKESVAWVNSNDAFVPVWMFTLDKNHKGQYITDRLGGIYAHVKKTVSLNDDIMEKEPAPAANLLMEILDSVIMLYQLASHKQLMKMSELRENFREMSCALNDTFYKLSLCPEHEKDVRRELINSKEVLENKVRYGFEDI